MTSDVLLQKKAGIERCIRQARAYYAMPSEKPFADDFYKQDAVVINLQRACEQCIDATNHVIRLKKLGLPSTSAESFTMLRKAGFIDAAMEKKLIGMVGFRNVITHQYQDVDCRRVEEVIRRHADDLIAFADVITALPE